jgi:Uma2 family endonuclease
LLALVPHVRDHRTGEVVLGPIGVVLSETTVVQPDLIYVASGREIIGPLDVQGAPDIIIEILAPHTRALDEIHKRNAYESSGVTEYWIVDHQLEVVTVYRRTGISFARVTEVSTETGGAITTPLLPGFSMDVSTVFAY